MLKHAHIILTRVCEYFEVGAVHTDVLAIYYALIMDGQHPMKMAIFAYLHVKPLPRREKGLLQVE